MSRRIGKTAMHNGCAGVFLGNSRETFPSLVFGVVPGLSRNHQSLAEINILSCAGLRFIADPIVTTELYRYVFSLK